MLLSFTSPQRKGSDSDSDSDADSSESKSESESTPNKKEFNCKKNDENLKNVPNLGTFLSNSTSESVESQQEATLPTSLTVSDVRQLHDAEEKVTSETIPLQSCDNDSRDDLGDFISKFSKIDLNDEGVIKKSDTVPETRLSNVTGIAYESVEASITVSDSKTNDEETEESDYSPLIPTTISPFHTSEPIDPSQKGVKKQDELLSTKPRVMGRPNGSEMAACTAKRQGVKRRLPDTCESQLHSFAESLSEELTLLCSSNITLRREDFETLRGNNWLNAKTICAFLNLLAINSKKEVLVFPYNLGLLLNSGRYEEWLYPQIRFGLFDIFVLPILDSQHWFLMVGDLKKRQIWVMDSWPSDPYDPYDPTKERAKRYLDHWGKYATCRNGIISSDILPALQAVERPSEEQKDWDSCGVFLMMNAEAVIYDHPVLRGQDDVPGYRINVMKHLVYSPHSFQKNGSYTLLMCNYGCGQKIRWIQCDLCKMLFHNFCKCNCSCHD